jgi:hypothetical protein
MGNRDKSKGLTCSLASASTAIVSADTVAVGRVTMVAKSWDDSLFLSSGAHTYVAWALSPRQAHWHPGYSRHSSGIQCRSTKPTPPCPIQYIVWSKEWYVICGINSISMCNYPRQFPSNLLGKHVVDGFWDGLSLFARRTWAVFGRAHGWQFDVGDFFFFLGGEEQS